MNPESILWKVATDEMDMDRVIDKYRKGDNDLTLFMRHWIIVAINQSNIALQ